MTPAMITMTPPAGNFSPDATSLCTASPPSLLDPPTRTPAANTASAA